MNPVDYLNGMHVKYSKAFADKKITKEKYDEFLEFYHEISSMYKKLSN